MFYSSDAMNSESNQYQDIILDTIPSHTLYRLPDYTRLIVHGSIGDNVTIPKVRNLEIFVAGNLGENVSIENHNGDISVEGSGQVLKLL